jgi:hypothetical protein
MTLGLAALRSFCGLLLIAMPWIVGEGIDGYGATNIGCGVAVVAAATQMHRAPWLRWVQASLAMAVFFLPFAFSADDVSDKQIYYAVLVGHMLLISAIVTPRLFLQEPSEPTSASDSSRSDGSNTSNVNTPSN